MSSGLAARARWWGLSIDLGGGTPGRAQGQGPEGSQNSRLGNEEV